MKDKIKSIKIIFIPENKDEVCIRLSTIYGTKKEYLTYMWEDYKIDATIKTFTPIEKEGIRQQIKYKLRDNLFSEPETNKSFDSLDERFKMRVMWDCCTEFEDYYYVPFFIRTYTGIKYTMKIELNKKSLTPYFRDKTLKKLLRKRKTI